MRVKEFIWLFFIYRTDICESESKETGWNFFPKFFHDDFDTKNFL